MSAVRGAEKREVPGAVLGREAGSKGGEWEGEAGKGKSVEGSGRGGDWRRNAGREARKD